MDTERETLRRLQGFLRGLAAALIIGTIFELTLAGHWGDLVQLIPFGLCALGLVALVLVRRQTSNRAVLTLRLVMAAVTLGSAVGVAEHFWGNRGFVAETRPGASSAALLWAGLTGGVPLLAPGILAVAAVVAIASTAGATGRVGEGSPYQLDHGLAASDRSTERPPAPASSRRHP